MPTDKTYKISTKRNNLYLRVLKGHFASANSHSNYYIDVMIQKSRLSEAKAVAEELVSYYSVNTVVDTILCLDGMEVIGTCLADELTKGHFMNMNAHRTIYVVTPEQTAGSQFIFRDGVLPMIKGKNVLVLAVSVATGRTVHAAVEAIKYYGGNVVGLASIYSAVSECGGVPVYSAFDANDLDGYYCVPPHECPLCKEGCDVDGVVNSYGFSRG